jgi:hypothetical protein
MLKYLLGDKAPPSIPGDWSSQCPYCRYGDPLIIYHTLAASMFGIFEVQGHGDIWKTDEEQTKLLARCIAMFWLHTFGFVI